MGDSSMKQRLLNAKSALTATIQKILDLNKSLRKAPFEGPAIQQELKQELKLLNKVADQQAKIVQLYEARIQKTGNS